MNCHNLIAWFDVQRGMAHDLVFAGQIFGGRHGESMQCPRDYEFHSGTLRMRFASTELLTVNEPSDFLLGEYGQLVIPRAGCATFGWHYYGRPQVPENWCEEIYTLIAEVVLMKRTGPLLPTVEQFELSGLPFVEFR